MIDDEQPEVVEDAEVVAETEEDAPKRTYLVCEAQKESLAELRQTALRFLSASGGGMAVVAADTMDEAVTIVMAETSRIGSYAVVECALIEFTAPRGRKAAKARRLELEGGQP